MQYDTKPDPQTWVAIWLIAFICMLSVHMLYKQALRRDCELVGNNYAQWYECPVMLID